MNKLLASVAAAAILVSTAAFAEPEGSAATTTDATASEAAPAKGDAAPVAKKAHKGKHHSKKHKKAAK